MVHTEIKRVKPEPVFSIYHLIESKKNHTFKKLLTSGIDKSLALDQLNSLFSQAKDAKDPIEFIDKLLSYISVKIDISEQDLDKIPLNGTVIVTSNHPFGGIEGLIMAKILKKRRPDVKLLANDLLHKILELRSLFFFVNPFGDAESIKKNISGVRQVKEWLTENHVLGVFPSGEVASFNPKTRKIAEPAWNENVAKFALASKATIVPMYFSGNNTLSFHVAGLIHPRLRTALLAHQFVNKKGQTIKVSIGNRIRPKEYQQLTNPKELVSYFETRTNMLKKKHKEMNVSSVLKPFLSDISKPISKKVLQEEVDNLDKEHLLVSTEQFDVFVAFEAQIPSLVREIGRIREWSFRLVGEGTGNEFDIDSYDSYYQHLFIWDKIEQKIVGAYRLAMIDNVLNVFGKKGLYSNSLFKLDQNFLDKVFPGIELGRSFVHPEYQRLFQPLLLLWKGITAFVVRNPNYRYLIGAVSISKDYSELSKQIIMAYLKNHHWNEFLEKLAKPRNPYTNKTDSIMERVNGMMSFLSMDQVNAMIKELDPDQGGIPILIKQYVKMNGKFVGFNVDSTFSDVVDGMIIVDLLKSDPESLHRYMGENEYKAYIEYHKVLLPEFEDVEI